MKLLNSLWKMWKIAQSRLVGLNVVWKHESLLCAIWNFAVKTSEITPISTKIELFIASYTIFNVYAKGRAGARWEAEIKRSCADKSMSKKRIYKYSTRSYMHNYIWMIFLLYVLWIQRWKRSRREASANWVISTPSTPSSEHISSSADAQLRWINWI